MRRIALFAQLAVPPALLAVLSALLAVVALPARALDRVTVQQLEQRLTADHARDDAHQARRLQQIQLTERLSTSRLARLRATLPGPESQRALKILADDSAALPPPVAEIPPGPAPSSEELKQIVQTFFASFESALPTPPDFDVTRVTTRFRNLRYSTSAHSEPIAVVTPMPLLVGDGEDTVTLRNGDVMVVKTKESWIPPQEVETGLEDWDPAQTRLRAIVDDMRGATPAWVRWEQGPAGKLAVFHFVVGARGAHLNVHTSKDSTGGIRFAAQPAYEAEMAVDSSTGTLYRIAIRFKIDPGKWVSRLEAVEEFATVAIDGQALLLPAKIIVIAVSNTVVSQSWGSDFNATNWSSSLSDTRPITYITDVDFRDYRLPKPGAPSVADKHFQLAAMGYAGERVTAVQLEKIIADGSSDREVAGRLTQLQLSQRLSADRFARLKSRLPGKSSADALLAISDLAEFLDLPPADLSPAAPPEPAAQGKIIASAVDFVARVTHKMPDLFATRQLARYEDLQVIQTLDPKGMRTPGQRVIRVAGQASPGPLSPGRPGADQELVVTTHPLVLAGQSTTTAHFREGSEIIETALPQAQHGPKPQGLDTWGAFGPILEIVMADVLKGKIGWSHWENGPGGALAVFRYAVAEADSHYDLRFCCYLDEAGLPSTFSARPGYHGELAIDPRTGAILRLMLKADLKHDDIDPARNPLLRADVLVDYAPVTIAGTAYFCPVRTISDMVSWTLGFNGPLKRPVSTTQGKKLAKDALQHLAYSRVNAINDAAFTDYHVFRTEMRIVSDGTSASQPPKQ